MLWSGEWVRRLEPGMASSEAEFRPRGRQALEQGGVYAAWRPVLERGGNSPERYPSRWVAGPLWLFWVVGLSTFGLRPLGTCLWGSWHVRFVFYYFSKKGVSPVIREPLWLSRQ
jgi:hypothetical protein